MESNIATDLAPFGSNLFFTRYDTCILIIHPRYLMSQQKCIIYKIYDPNSQTFGSEITRTWHLYALAIYIMCYIKFKILITYKLKIFFLNLHRKNHKLRVNLK